MSKNFTLYAFLTLMLLLGGFCYAASPYEATKNLPGLYQGRFRSLESIAQMQLYELSHKRNIGNTTALEFLWDSHLRGTERWKETPLFWVRSARTKELLGLDLRQDRFSYDILSTAIRAKEGTTTSDNDVANLTQRLNSFVEESLRMLPAKNSPGAWLSLKSLDSSKNNITEFSDAEFDALRNAYRELKEAATNESPDLSLTAAKFAKIYNDAYGKLAGKPYRKASGKALTYPTENVLTFETLYYRTPLVDITIALYALALFAFLLKSPRATSFGWGLLLSGLVVHTFTLGLRSYILGRPPVTNMFETVIYVPWIALVLAVVVAWKQKSKAVVSAGCLAAIALLTILKISDLDARMENVQAVLDSQFWLIIHVLMVVGSYGAFILSGALGHLYLVKYAQGPAKREELPPLARGILTTLYVGVGLLIPGTILGGVWAAESWGRFWDWDPKESWAFISACVYLVVIHAYTFRKVSDLGLAIGSVIGLVSISFTWYGVNYVLGTGLHSYGFGTGSPLYYFAYLAAEAIFIAGSFGIGLERRRG